MKASQQDEHYTYADYLTWDDDARYELIDGIPYMLASPNTAHQRICMALSNQLYDFLKGKPCEVFAAPYDVRLNAGEDDDTVVQPDLLVVCDKSKLGEKSCVGAPDLIIEILSPSSAARDKVLKFNKYWRAGVREYWIVYPDSQTVTVHVLMDGNYVTREYADTDNVSMSVLDGCVISLPDVFAE